MSRIWKLPIAIPEKVEVKINGNNVEVKWPNGSLNFEFLPSVEVKIEDNNIVVTPVEGAPNANALWGTTRSVLANMVEGVEKKFVKSLEINWVGYKFEVQGNKLVLSIGYSHKVEMEVSAWLEAKLDDKQKNILHISWIDKQLVGQFASKVKAKKKPEPYKGKWIKYVWEHIRRKAWKTGAK